MKNTIASVIASFAMIVVVPFAVAKDKADQAATSLPTAAQVIEMSVTKAGFVPAQVKVKVGQPVKLVITRKTDHTCAKDIVIKDYSINQPLPLNQIVEVAFTPTKPGSSRFACAMDMIAGMIIVE
jgi:plastocyanin domain-containing protein